MRLLARQKIELLKFAKKNGFEEQDFEFSDVPDKIMYYQDKVIITFKPKPEFFFSTYDTPRYGEIVCSPGDNELVEKQTMPYNSFIHFDLFLSHFDYWLESLKQEIPFDDLWNRISSGKFIKDEFFDSNEKFTNDEINVLKGNISKLQLSIGKIPNLLEEHKQQVIQQLEELKGKAENKKFTKKDYYLLFMGTVFSWAVSGIPAPQMGAIWEAVKLFFASHQILIH